MRFNQRSIDNANGNDFPRRRMIPQPVICTEFIDSSPLLSAGDFAALRGRANDEGYLFFKGLLPVAELMRVRADMLAVVERYGWLQPEQDALGGRLDLAASNAVPDEAMRKDIGVSHAAYDDVQKLASFHRLPHHPALGVYKGLFGDEVFVHPRHIARTDPRPPRHAPNAATSGFPPRPGQPQHVDLLVSAWRLST